MNPTSAHACHMESVKTLEAYTPVIEVEETCLYLSECISCGDSKYSNEIQKLGPIFDFVKKTLSAFMPATWRVLLTLWGHIPQ